MPTTKTFFQTRFSWIDGDCKLGENEELSLQVVEELIEFELEPVERWIGLDPEIQHQKELQKEEEAKKLFQLYLQPHRESFAIQFGRMEKILQAERGALFYYPDTLLENDGKALFFRAIDYLKTSSYTCEKLALPYVEKYNQVTEMVICVRTNDGYNICNILSKCFIETDE